jgi:hypothetical protein
MWEGPHNDRRQRLYRKKFRTQEREHIVKRKHVVGSLVVVVIVAIAVFLFSRPTGPAIQVGTEKPIDPAQTVTATDSRVASALGSAIDRTARWGFILYDDVKMVPESGQAGTAGNGVMSLHTGDQVYIAEFDEAHKGQTKVTLFDGKSGWVDSSQIFEVTSFAPWNVLDSSTAPLKDLIPAELIPPEAIQQYQVVVSSDFMMRASKNPNPTIAEWADAVLSAQAERAAQ